MLIKTPLETIRAQPAIMTILSQNMTQQTTDSVLRATSIFILHQLLKGQLERKEPIDSLKIDANQIMQVMETSCSAGDELVSMIAAGLLAEFLDLGGSTATFVRSKISSNDGMSLLVSLLNTNSEKNYGGLKIMQGTNFGCPYIGFFDAPLKLMQKAQMLEQDSLIN